MDALNIVFLIIILICFSISLYSFIRWLIVFISDHKDLLSRRKYALRCLLSFISLCAVLFVSLAVFFSRAADNRPAF